MNINESLKVTHNHKTDSWSNLIDLICSRADTHHDKIIYEFIPLERESNEIQLTFGELAKRSKAVAASLQQRGLNPGDRAILIAAPGIDLIVAFFGCVFAGVIAVPCYPPLNPKLYAKLKIILNEVKPQIIISTKELTSMLIHHGAQNMGLDVGSWLISDDVPLSSSDSWSNPQIHSQHLAFLQYTSGSTSSPKGVMVSHENLIHNLNLLQEGFSLTHESKIVSWLPPYHDMGLIGAIMAPIYSAGSSTLMTPFEFLQNPSKWLKLITRQKATHSGGPNFAYDYCVRKITAEQKESLDLSHWVLAFNGAEPIHADTLKRFYEAFKECGFRKDAFHTCYGLAEATLMVSVGKADQNKELFISSSELKKNRVQFTNASDPDARLIVNCGRLYQDARIVNPETCMASLSDEIGEIWVRSQSVTQGFWQNQEQTHMQYQAMISNDSEKVTYLRTGDLGFINNDDIYVTGRIKDLIIVHGQNYYPQDIEKIVNRSHSLIRAGQGVAFSMEINDEERLVVVTEVEPSTEPKEYEHVFKTIKNNIMNELGVSVYAIKLIQPKTIEKTTSGKLQRSLMKKQMLENQLSLIAEWTCE